MIHRIRRQILELELPREAGAVALQRQVGQVFQEKVLPVLDELFSQIAPADRILRIERLEIDLGRLGEANWERQFIERCVAQITQQITELAFEAEDSAAPSVQTLNPAENALEIFQAFLKTGTLPWYAKGMSLKNLEEYLAAPTLAQSGTLQKLLSVLFQQEAVLHRLIWQFSSAFVEKTLEIALRLSPGQLTQALQILGSHTGQKMDAKRRMRLFKLLLTSNAAGTLSLPTEPYALVQFFSQLQADLLPSNTSLGKLPDASGPEQTTQPRIIEVDQLSDAQPNTAGQSAQNEVFKKPPQNNLPPTGIIVDHAGLVLLGPYLPTYFQALQLGEAGVFASPDDQYRAVHLLHFLATGLENPEEPMLVLPKILCGLSIEDPVPLELALSEVEKRESHNLLQAAIHNWPVLKNTSPDGLRSGFLQRMGQLSHSQTQALWLLRVERMGQDLLLDRLPWSISVIKLPWMEAPMQVEW